MEDDKDSKRQLYEKLKKLVEKDINKSMDKQNLFHQLPASLWAFMKNRAIDIDEVLLEIPRFIRLKHIQPAKGKKKDLQDHQPQMDKKITQQDLIADLKISLDEIVKVDQSCYALAPSCKINNSKLYQEAKIYGMDVSSMFAVQCLDLERGNSLLELCSAPGNKSMYACDLCPEVHATAVQINPTRANVMKNLIRKYELADRIHVFVEDATKFESKQLFDKVLVDSECTHEGSVKHLKKFTAKNNLNKKQNHKEQKDKTKQQQKQFLINHNPYTSQYDSKNQWSAQDFEKRFLDPVKLNNLYDLQLALIVNGFKLLKPGGFLVYSTCSIDQRQNESIVEQLLKQFPEAKLVDVQESLKNCQLTYRKGTLKQTVYFTPKLSMCGGMFISKIFKLEAKLQSQGS